MNETPKHDVAHVSLYERIDGHSFDSFYVTSFSLSSQISCCI